MTRLNANTVPMSATSWSLRRISMNIRLMEVFSASGSGGTISRTLATQISSSTMKMTAITMARYWKPLA